MDAGPIEIARIFPALGRFSEGVGVKNARGDVWVFWSRTTSEILAACERAGYPISEDIESVSKMVWKPWSA